MADYKISQRPKKQARSKPKKFWAPKLQKQKLNQKNTLAILAAAGVVIIVGAVFAAIKISGQKPTKPSALGPAIINSPSALAQKGVPAAEYQAVQNSVTAKDATLLNKYFASKVRIVIVDSNINEFVNAAQAAELINDGLAATQNPWNFNVSTTDIQKWQQGPYGQYFSGDILVGVSANGDVISVGFDNNGQINSVFIAPSGVLDNNSPPQSSGSSSGSSAGSALPVPTGATPQD